MPININDLDLVDPNDEPDSDADLQKQVAELQSQMRALQSSYQSLTNYCQSLEEACRTSFAECPGVSPFPTIVLT